MRLHSLTIRDFRRFSYLHITNIPASAKLLVLAGPNGSGKSSLFDAFRIYHQQLRASGLTWEEDYHRKTSSETTSTWTSDSVQLHLHPTVASTDLTDSSNTTLNTSQLDSEQKKKLFYIRSAYRHEAEFSVNLNNRIPSHLDIVPAARMIDLDRSVGRNYQLLVGQAIADIFEPDPDETPNIGIHEYAAYIIGTLNLSLQQVLPDLQLTSLGAPPADGTFRFTKGTATDFAYKNLSGGEKAVFDLLLDLHVATPHFDDTIYCIDEPESHLSTRVQGKLLEVIYNHIPEGSQMVLATHATGMMRMARDLWRNSSDAVCFLDFGNLNFDQPVTIEPSVPDRRFWQEQYAVALDDLATLLAPERLVICEGAIGDPEVAIHANHDARCYNTIFSHEFPDTTFISGGGGTEIEGDHYGLATAFGLLHSKMQVVRLIDRDDRSDERVATLLNRGVRVLSRRHIESYLFDEEVLRALAVAEGQPEKADVLVAVKDNELPPNFDIERDDIKKVTGNIFKAVRKELGITRQGEDAKEFARTALAPLVTPGTNIYSMLKHDIFG